jgi:predicted secreted Zn-dependent protease
MTMSAIVSAPARRARVAVATLTALALLSEPLGVEAGVTTSTTYRDYRVSGSTPSGLVTYMRSHPFPGDRGAAVANIRPSYSLSVSTKTSGGICRASSVNLKVNFVMTLPKATTSLSGGTRSSWNNFVAFARRHEETHRSIYIGCARNFVAKAQRLTAGSCFTLQSRIRAMLDAERRACDRKHAAFDRRDAGRIFGLGLFAQARKGRPSSRMASKSR